MVSYVGGDITVTIEDPDRMSWFELKGILDDRSWLHAYKEIMICNS